MSSSELEIPVGLVFGGKSPSQQSDALNHGRLRQAGYNDKPPQWVPFIITPLAYQRSVIRHGFAIVRSLPLQCSFVGAFIMYGVERSDGQIQLAHRVGRHESPPPTVKEIRPYPHELLAFNCVAGGHVQPVRKDFPV